MTPHTLDLDFPAWQADEPPALSVDEWAAWLEEARVLQDPAVFEQWLNDPGSMPRGERFELID